MEEPNEIDEYIPNGVDNGEEYSSDEDAPDGISGEDPLKYLDLDSTRNKRKELPVENGTVFVGIKEANDNETSLNKPKDEKDHETVEKDEKLSSPTAQPKTEQLYPKFGRAFNFIIYIY